MWEALKPLNNLCRCQKMSIDPTFTTEPSNTDHEANVAIDAEQSNRPRTWRVGVQRVRHDGLVNHGPTLCRCVWRAAVYVVHAVHALGKLAVN